MSHRFRFWLVVTLAMVLAMCGGPLLALSWDAERDFLISDNPNGAWSYGWSANLNSGYAFHLLPYGVTLTYSPVIGLERRNPSTSSTEPGICRNPTSGTLSNWGVTWLPHTMSLHPGPNGEDCIVRWTAPAAGTYAISGDFHDVTGGALRPMCMFCTTECRCLMGWSREGRLSLSGLRSLRQQEIRLTLQLGLGRTATMLGTAPGWWRP